MKHIFLITSMWLCISYASGQNNYVDSLVIVLETESLTSAEKAGICKDICNEFFYSDSDKLLYYAEKGLQYAGKAKDKDYTGHFLRFMGSGYYIKGDYDTAINYFNDAIVKAIETDNKYLEAIAYGSVANAYTFTGKEILALEYFLKALAVFESLEDKKSAAIALCNIGSTHYGLNNINQALIYFDRAKAIAEELNDDYLKSLVYYQYADYYSKNREHDKAIENSLKVYESSLRIGEKQGEILSLQSLAYEYSEGKKQYDKSEEYALECLDVAREYGDPRLILTAKCILSTVYIYQQRYRDCKELLYDVWQNDSVMVLNIRSNITNVLGNLTKSCYHLGDNEEADYYLLRYQELLVDAIDKEFQESITEMQTKYETEKKEMRITSLEQEKQMYIWLGIAGIIIAVGSIMVLWQQIRNQRKERELIATRSVLDGEMSERSRLAHDLHDRLGGNLSALKIRIVNNPARIENIFSMLDSCIEEIRRVAHNLMPTSLQFGLKFALQDYAAQFPDVNFHFFGNEVRIGERTEFILYCCACELVNNSLKHSGAENINLQLVQDEKHTTLTVQDDGKGYDEKTIKLGLGLKNIHDRVTSCNGKIDIVTAPDKGTETTIELKIK